MEIFFFFFNDLHGRPNSSLPLFFFHMHAYRL